MKFDSQLFSLKRVVLAVIIFSIFILAGFFALMYFLPIFPPSSFSNGSDFNFIFRYGVGAKNELNTATEIYTKDMVIGSPVRIKMRFSQGELDSIRQKMQEIGFLNYPNVFKVSTPFGVIMGAHTPYDSYYFKVVYDGKTKELFWDDEIDNTNMQADKLRELIQYIRKVIESKEEYRKLPESRGGYM